MIAIHLVVRSRLGRFPFREDHVSRVTWCKLAREFPTALACVLMPNHVHLILPQQTVRGASRDRRRFAICMRAVSRAGRLGPTWEPVPEPRVIEDRAHLRRQVRYVHRNPCRSRLVADPKDWVWSTHRDLLGWVWPDWADSSQLAAALGESDRGFVSRFRRYVAFDAEAIAKPDVAAPMSLRNLSASQVQDLLRRVARSSSELAQRKLIAQVLWCHRDGRSLRYLARECGVASSTFSDWVRREPVDERLLAALAGCYGGESG